jgi:hypothetical protein
VELNCGGEDEVQTGGRKGKAMEAEDVDENPPEKIRPSWAVAAFIRVEGHASTVQAGGSDARNPPGVPKSLLNGLGLTRSWVSGGHLPRPSLKKKSTTEIR